MENFGGDPYHVPTSHKSTVELGISPSYPLYSSFGHQVVLEHGHCVNVNVAAPGSSSPPYQGLPEEMWPMFERNLTKEQLEIFKKCTVIVGSCFPSLSFHCPIHGSEGHLHNYLTLRVWRPLGPTKVEIWSWFLIDKSAPEEYKEAAYKDTFLPLVPREHWNKMIPRFGCGWLMRAKPAWPGISSSTITIF